jgi:hypothetical protein
LDRRFSDFIESMNKPLHLISNAQCVKAAAQKSANGDAIWDFGLDGIVSGSFHAVVRDTWGAITRMAAGSKTVRQRLSKD